MAQNGVQIVTFENNTSKAKHNYIKSFAGFLSADIVKTNVVTGVNCKSN